MLRGRPSPSVWESADTSPPLRHAWEPHPPFTSSSSIVVLELSVDSCREGNTLSVRTGDSLASSVLTTPARDVRIMQNPQQAVCAPHAKGLGPRGSDRDEGRVLQARGGGGPGA